MPPLEELFQRAGRPFRTPARKESDARGDPADEEVDDAAREEPEPAEDLGDTLRRFAAPRSRQERYLLGLSDVRKRGR